MTPPLGPSGSSPPPGEAVRCDVCVVGGGPAGSAVAVRLARAARLVLLAEAGDYGEARPGEHLAPDVGPALEALGAGAALARLGTSPGTVSLWGGPAPVIEPAYPIAGGRTVARGAFDRDLATAAQTAGARLALGWRLSGIAPAEPGWRLTFAAPDGPHVVAAAYVVDASGRQAAFARRAGARVQRRDGLVALVARSALPVRVGEVEAEEPGIAAAAGTAAETVAGVGIAAAAAIAAAAGIAAGAAPSGLQRLQWLHVEAIAGGWWYAVASPDQTVGAAFFAPLGSLCRTRVRYADVWRAALARSEVIAPLLPPEMRRGAALRLYPAAPALTEPPCGRDWIAVGDAAVQWDPLAGTGVRRALETGMRGAEVALLAANERATVLPYYTAALHALYGEHCQTRERIYAEAAPRLGRAFFDQLGLPFPTGPDAAQSSR